jgi:leader peptidase (prepilin peptidase)/N-methyltransferase
MPLLGGLLSGGRGTYLGQPTGYIWTAVELGTAALFAAFAYAYLDIRCQQTPDVLPSEFWRVGRLFYHLVLMALLIAATGTDFREYTISDWITMPGLIFGVGAAALSGELQMMHIWVDWHYEVPGYQGPYRPEWMDQHRHLHGLAWSVFGAVVGAAASGLLRAIAKLLLGREAMGFGDITLMAMIGSFIGWQPVMFVLLIAPLCGIAGSLGVRLLTERTFVPFGPYLSAAAVIVLLSWLWVWLLVFTILNEG